MTTGHGMGAEARLRDHLNARVSGARSATVKTMAPTIVRDGQFRLFFFSREETRIHVHVAHPDGEAKFWLTPNVSVATSTGLAQRQLCEAQLVVEAHIEEIRNAWNRHFGA